MGAVISVRMLGGGGDAAGYYLQAEPGERELDRESGYYLDGEEPAGVWAGRGTAPLDLAGGLGAAAGAGAFRALLAGRDPRTGLRLVPPVLRTPAAAKLAAGPVVAAIRAEATSRRLEPAALVGELAATFTRLEHRTSEGETVSASARSGGVLITADLAGRLATAAGLDPTTVYRTADGSDRFGAAVAASGQRVDVRRAGVDVTVSAPKSVSALYGLADSRVAREVRAGHEVAVRTALAYLDAHASHGLRGHQGDGQRAAHVSSDGLIAAAFTHVTSRADDPQLHTHLVIANLVHGADGKWSALDSRALHRQAPAASYLYQAVLRAELTRRLGLAWGPVERGIAELAGVPVGVREEFSTRRAQINAVLRQLGRTDRAAAQYATLATRQAKTHTGETRLRARWAERVRSLGHDPAVLVRDALGQTTVPDGVTLESLRELLLGPTGLTGATTSIDARDVVQAICEHLPAGAPVSLEQVEAWTRQILRDDEVVPLVHRAADGLPRYTTTELLHVEHRALRIAQALRSVDTTTVSVDAVSDDAARCAQEAASSPTRPTPGLRDEQEQVVAALTTGPTRLMVVTGPAGSGKTAILATAHHCWQQAGVTVHGCAVAALAARGLERATGIRSTTLVRTLAALESGAGPGRGDVLVVDEAGMVATRELARLLEHAHHRAFRIVLVGDPAQLPEIGAGGLFAALARHPDTHHLTGNVRQQHAWEREALAALRAGDVETALGAYGAHGRIHTHDRAAQATADLLATYADRTASGNADVVILTPTRADAAALNRLVHTMRRVNGQLGQAVRITTPHEAGVEFSIGDRLLITRNHPTLGLANGTRATLTAIGRDRFALRTDDGRELAVPNALFEHGEIQHGYALTIHKAQGQTVDIALIHATGGLSAEAGYVALSRARHETHIYTSRTNLLGTAAPGGLGTSAVVHELAEQLQRRRAHTLASRLGPFGARDLDGSAQGIGR